MKNSTEPSPDRLKELLGLYLETEEGFGLDRIPLSARDSEAGAPCAGDTLAGGDALAAGDTLAGLKERVTACTACPLSEHRTQVVFGEGDPQADLLFVGEAPGAEEDRTGIPFVGRAGKLLTRMIEAMGFQREKVYIGNIIKCRPPGNRTPNPLEIDACRGYLEKQIRIISPVVIVALGAPSARTLLEREEGIGALRGRVYPYPRDPKIRIVPTYHPAYLLRNESEKGKAWQDLQLAMELLKDRPIEDRQG